MTIDRDIKDRESTERVSELVLVDPIVSKPGYMYVLYIIHFFSFLSNLFLI